MSVCLVLLAYRTTFNEFVNVGSQPWPPEVTFKEGFGTESASMPKGRGGMQGRYKGMTSIWWNVHLSFIIQMAPFVCPIFYRGAGE